LGANCVTGLLPLALVLRDAFRFCIFLRAEFLIRFGRRYGLGGVAPSALFQDRNERDGQFLDVGLKSRGRNLGPLPPRETLQALGQFARFGHGRAVDEDGDDANVSFERGLDLDPDEIIWIVETAPPLGISGGNPLPSNDRDQRVARAHEIDVVDIEEDVFALKPLHNAIMNRARGECRRLPPIANEDAARHTDVLAPQGN
jgi:hypothetical protein